jgi:hypothetical protein
MYVLHDILYMSICSLIYFLFRRQIKDSVDDPEMGKTNIADLAAAVVGKTGMKPTIQLYIRLAFLVSKTLSF